MTRPRFNDARWRVVGQRYDESTSPPTWIQYWELYDEVTHVMWRAKTNGINERARTAHPPEDVWV